MRGRSLLLSLSLLLLYLFSPLSVPSPNPNLFRHFSADAARTPKIYLYDLPRKLTYSVIHSYAAARGGAAEADPKALKYPGNQHSAEWFLFEDLNRVGSPVQSLLDPEEADLFYVTFFFSSLSLVVNPSRPADGLKENAYSDEEMQDDLIDWLEGNKYWKRNNGRDHVFIMQDPNALYKVIEDQE